VTLKLTKRGLDTIRPTGRASITYDSELKGFGVRIGKTGGWAGSSNTAQVQAVDGSLSDGWYSGRVNWHPRKPAPQQKKCWPTSPLARILPRHFTDTAARRVCDYIAGSCRPSPRLAAPTSELAEPPAGQVERS